MQISSRHSAAQRASTCIALSAAVLHLNHQVVCALSLAAQKKRGAARFIRNFPYAREAAKRLETIDVMTEAAGYIPCGRLGDEGNLRIRKAGAQRAQRGNGQQHLPHGESPENCDLPNGTLGIHGPLLVLDDAPAPTQGIWVTTTPLHPR